MFELKTVEELVRIAGAGGGFSLKSSLKSSEELVRIAAAASTKGARIVFEGLELRSTEEIVRIALAGKGCVAFEPKKE